jgi:glutamate racemase
VGQNVRVIDPAPAVSRQVRRLLEAKDLLSESDQDGRMEFFTSGDSTVMEMLLPKLLGESGKVKTVNWIKNLEITLR